MKYIVYLTTNIVNKKIYVGVHKTETPETFDHYLGCGIKDNDVSVRIRTKIVRIRTDNTLKKTISLQKSG